MGLNLPGGHHLHLSMPSGALLTLILFAVAVEVVIFAGSSIHAWLRAPHGKPPHYAKTWLGWHLVPPWKCWRWLVVAIIRRGHTHATRAVERHDHQRAAAPALGPQATRGGAGRFRPLAGRARGLAAASPALAGACWVRGRRGVAWGCAVAGPRLARLAAWRPLRRASADPAPVAVAVSPPPAGE
jgi:hypothetical protein